MTTIKHSDSEREETALINYKMLLYTSCKSQIYFFKKSHMQNKINKQAGTINWGNAEEMRR